MSKLSCKILSSLKSSKIELFIFACLSIATASIAVSKSYTLGIQPTTIVPIQTNNTTGRLQLTGALSQTKVVQNENAEVYATISIQSPKLEQTSASVRGTDLVVVLDRSGSMNTPEKLPYAKSAVKELVSHLTEHDRFALVSFSDTAVVDFPMSPISALDKMKLIKVVDNIESAGGTNIEHSLQTAWNLIEQNPSSRMRKVIFLSDGEATSGNTSDTVLKKLASQANFQEAMLSTIGMGLGFNELLMSSLADHGMGNFAYLETLQQLGTILSKELNETKTVYAENSTLNIRLPQGVKLVDAAGYPVVEKGSGNINIKTGRLLSGKNKSFALTLSVPNKHIRNFNFSNIKLHYTTEGKQLNVSLPPQSLTLKIVEPEKRLEAIASIDESLYSEIWQKNNTARMDQTVSNHLRKGEKEKAKQAIADYKLSIQKAEETSGIKLYNKVAPQLNKLDNEVEHAFEGSLQEQQIKRNRLAKKSYAESRQKQRYSK